MPPLSVLRQIICSIQQKTNKANEVKGLFLQEEEKKRCPLWKQCYTALSGNIQDLSSHCLVLKVVDDRTYCKDFYSSEGKTQSVGVILPKSY